MRALVAAAAAFVALGCSTANQTVRVGGDQADAVYGTLIGLAMADLKANGLLTTACFLAVEGRDASAATLSSLPAYPVPFKKLSESARQEGPAGEFTIVDRATGKPGAVISVAIERWRSPNEVEASYGWEQGRLALRSRTVLLRHAGGRWVVDTVLFELQS